MTTLSKIKGGLNNPNLPVITSDGFVDYWFGVYVNALATQGYTLTQIQKNAVATFINTLTENNLLPYISAIYPFIGSASNKNAAKVPICGTKLLDFAESFDGIVFDESDNIIGLNKCPEISSFKLGDVISNTGNVVGAAISGEKTATESNPLLTKFLNFNSTSSGGLDIRISNNYFALFFRRSSGIIESTQFSGTNITNSAGNFYAMACVKYTNFVRYYDYNGDIYNNDGNLNYSPNITSSDLNRTLVSSNYNSAYTALTSVTFFIDLMTKEQVSTYMTALKTMMIALGRHE